MTENCTQNLSNST